MLTTPQQFKASLLASLSQYYQALTDNDSNAYGTAIARLQLAEKQAKEASRIANNFPTVSPSTSNLSTDTASILTETCKKHSARVKERLGEYTKDNDFIYHSIIPSEASLSAVQKMPAAKAISISELYQGQDIHRIIGPDIFQKIVPMSVTESASLYDEEKAKLVRAEAERVDTANSEMAASLDYLKLPSSLNVLKGGMDQEMNADKDFRSWCQAAVDAEPFSKAVDGLSTDKIKIQDMLDQSTKQLDMEESVCEKMRSKYGAEWTQQPSSRLSATLRNDIKNYRGAVDEAGSSDAQLQSTCRQYEQDFEEMRRAGESDEADVLYQKAMIQAGALNNRDQIGSSHGNTSPEGNLLDDDFEDGSASVADQIAKVESLLQKLNLIKRERSQVLKDLKEKVMVRCEHERVGNLANDFVGTQ